MYVGRYVGVYVCMYVCMHACMHACMYVCTGMHVRVYVCMHVSMYVSVSADSEAKRAPKEPVAIQKGKLEKGTGGNRNEAEVSQKGIKVP